MYVSWGTDFQAPSRFDHQPNPGPGLAGPCHSRADGMPRGLTHSRTIDASMIRRPSQSPSRSINRPMRARAPRGELGAAPVREQIQPVNAVGLAVADRPFAIGDADRLVDALAQERAAVLLLAGLDRRCDGVGEHGHARVAVADALAGAGHERHRIAGNGEGIGRLAFPEFALPARKLVVGDVRLLRVIEPPKCASRAARS